MLAGRLKQFSLSKPKTRFARASPSSQSGIIFKVALGILSFFLSTCKESLPAYHPPAGMFDARLNVVYALSPIGDSLHVSMTVQNIFDETTDGIASLRGQIQLFSVKDSRLVKTFTLSPANLIHAKSYNRATGVLTIDPGDAIVVDASWDLSARPLLDESGKDLASELQSDPDCAFRKKRPPEDLALQGYLEMYKQTGPAIPKQAIYTFCLISNWVNQNNCPPPIGGSCNVMK